MGYEAYWLLGRNKFGAKKGSSIGSEEPFYNGVTLKLIQKNFNYFTLQIYMTHQYLTDYHISIFIKTSIKSIFYR
ncbi:hypothetical protein GCM10009430_27450 [Aquimarina litoralis]|uniref:Uncharacterized protein n=1 Tax=Aquimarina litoralis TaxID=584605 RepID=A0ABP3U3M7_9FLAO